MFLIRVLLPLHKVKSLSVYHPQVRGHALCCDVTSDVILSLTFADVFAASVLCGPVPGKGQQFDRAGEFL